MASLNDAMQRSAAADDEMDVFMASLASEPDDPAARGTEFDRTSKQVQQANLLQYFKSAMDQAAVILNGIDAAQQRKEEENGAP